MYVGFGASVGAGEAVEGAGVVCVGAADVVL